MPHCRRCLNAGRICTGYRAEDELVFRDMSETAKDKVQSRVKDRKAKRSLKNNDSLASGSAGTPDLDSEDLDFSNPAALCPFDHHSVEICTAKNLLGSVPLPLSPDWASQAPAIFFADYVYCSPQPRYPGGYLEFLPSLCIEESQSSCLMEALDAVSFANLTSQSSLNWLIRRARCSYGKALVSLHAALQDPQEVIKDSTLASVLLMGLYEVGFSVVG